MAFCCVLGLSTLCARVHCLKLGARCCWNGVLDALEMLWNSEECKLVNKTAAVWGSSALCFCLALLAFRKLL